MQKLATLHILLSAERSGLGRFAFGISLHFHLIVVVVWAMVNGPGVIKHVEVAFLAN